VEAAIDEGRGIAVDSLFKKWSEQVCHRPAGAWFSVAIAMVTTMAMADPNAAPAAAAAAAAPSAFGNLASVTQAWQLFVVRASALLRSSPRSIIDQDFQSSVRVLCDQGLGSLVVSYFLDSLEVRD